MRFSTRRSTPNYLGGSQQRRLLMTILLLALVLFLMREAGKPANWQWFVALNNPAPAPAEPAEIDTRLRPSVQEEALPGAFSSPPENPPASAAPGYFAGVKPGLLESVRDDTVFRGAEHDAFFHLLEILHDTDSQTIEAASRGQAAFVQLYHQPEEYRGKLVSLRGTVRGVFDVQASRNDYGIVRYYQLWLQPYDNPSLPVVVYVLELPPGFPTAERMQEEVELTGFFFKRWAYRAQDAIRSAPLVLAKTVQWERPVVAETPPMTLAYVAGLVACALLGAGIVVWMALRSGSAVYSGPMPPRQWGAAPESADVSPAEALKRLVEQSQEEVVAASGPPAGERSGDDEQRPVS